MTLASIIIGCSALTPWSPGPEWKLDYANGCGGWTRTIVPINPPAQDAYAFDACEFLGGQYGDETVTRLSPKAALFDALGCCWNDNGPEPEGC